MDEKLKSGDTVRLKSGGPVMTCQNVVNGVWLCKWFVQAELREGRFEAPALEVVEKGKAGTSF